MLLTLAADSAPTPRSSLPPQPRTVSLEEFTMYFGKLIHDGKTEAEVDAEWAEGGECNAVDLTEEMDEARTVAEALCAPATLS